jgi:hypothetical protein
MNYYIAVNAYRSSTGNGFSNTWGLYKCRNRKEQLVILERGLPVSDTWYQNRYTGERSLMYSNFGVRLLTTSERRSVKPEELDFLTI